MKPLLEVWEAWFDQSDRSGNFDIKVGQQSVDLYAGGPAYPLSSLGVRLRASLGAFTLLGGVFDDNPPGGSFSNDDQRRDAERTGTGFNLGGGALFLAELQYAVDPPPPNGGGYRDAYPGTYRLGGWFDTGRFPDQRYDDAGISLADSAETDGQARLRRHNFGVYVSVDQALWTDHIPKGRRLGAFLRLIGAPGDRNMVSFSADGGLSLRTTWMSRPRDVVGLGFGVAHISPRAAALDQDTRTFSGNSAYPVRSSETFVELVYQAQITGWLMVQPDLQYVWTPGGGIPNPLNEGGATLPRIGNELVIGARMTLTL